jgi:hypothetical protein
MAFDKFVQSSSSMLEQYGGIFFIVFGANNHKWYVYVATLVTVCRDVEFVILRGSDKTLIPPAIFPPPGVILFLFVGKCLCATE